ncbi:MAG TPA: PatB family C-S lyase [Paucimonas sp.]|nr:PatB family C-S lyase [Paucimonas sp.]
MKEDPATNFDGIGDRLAWSAIKWEKYRGRDVIPLWVADMDFPVAPAIRAALQAHVEHACFGYMNPPHELPGALVDHHRRHYSWNIDPDWIVWLPGLVLGINLAVKACCAAHETAISFSPVYPPFLAAPAHQGRGLIDVPLKQDGPDGLRYAIDFELLEASVTADTRLLLLCHPHNPIGRPFTRAELARLAAFCDRHDLHVCSDEVHCDLILDGTTTHLPFAAALADHAPRLLPRTITLNGPGKTYNIAGLGIAWAIIPDADLRARFGAAMQGLVPDPCGLGFTALLAALRDGDSWRRELLARLRANRDAVSQALDAMGLPHTHPEATYLTWIDARRIEQSVGNAHAWFERWGVGLSDGAPFGRPGFLRLNFACPKDMLDRGLARMRAAVETATRPGTAAA